MKLYKTFFYGENMTNFECDIEQNYLATKQSKYFAMKRINNKNKKLKVYCIWTNANQRRIELMLNFRLRNFNYFDDFFPIFQV